MEAGVKASKIIYTAFIIFFICIDNSTVENMVQSKQFANIWDGIYSAWIYPYGFLAIYNPDDVEVCIECIIKYYS